MGEKIDMGKRIAFGYVAVGEFFNTGHQVKSDGKLVYLKYRKTGPSTAVCVDQVGWGNTRQVNTRKSFSASSNVWRMEA